MSSDPAVQLNGARDDSVHRIVRRMFGRDSVYAAVWGLQIVVVALFTPVNTRILGSRGFGQVAAALALMQVLFALASMCLQAAVQRHYPETDGDAKSRKVLTLAILTAMVVVVCIDTTGGVWARALGFRTYGGAVRLAVYWAAFAAMTDAGLGLLRSRDRLWSFTAVSLTQSVGAQAASLVLVLLLHSGAASFIGGQLAGQVVAFAICTAAAPPRMIHWGDYPLLRGALRYSAPLLPSALAAFVLSTSDRLIVQKYQGPVQVGRYQVAYNIGALAIALLTALNTIWMPHIFAVRERHVQSRLLTETRDGVRRILLPVVVGLSAASPIVLHIWVPAAFEPDRLLMVVAVVTVSSLPYSTAMAYTRVLVGAGRTGWVGGSFVLAAAVNFALNLVLVPAHGILGSAVATLIAYGTLALVSRLCAGAIMPVTGTTPAMATAIAAAMAVACGTALLPSTPWWLLPRSLLAGGCLAWFAFVLRRLQVVGRRPRRATTTVTVPTTVAADGGEATAVAG